MGNCLRRGHERREEEAKQQRREEGTEGLVKESVDFVKEGGSGGGGCLKLKIVLTKEELEWLMIQLKSNEGKRLEDVLAEIGRERSGKVEAWKPSLESVMEEPEVLDMDT